MSIDGTEPDVRQQAGMGQAHVPSRHESLWLKPPNRIGPARFAAFKTGRDGLRPEI
jgi:hypothetical protein